MTYVEVISLTHAQLPRCKGHPEYYTYRILVNVGCVTKKTIIMLTSHAYQGESRVGANKLHVYYVEPYSS